MTNRIAIAMTAAAAALTFTVDAQSAPCRDAKGHFTACPAPSAAATAKERCRDAKGHFISCAGTAHAANTSAAAPAQTGSILPFPSPRASVARTSRAPTGMARNTAATAPGAITARCRDGSVSHSQTRSGTCSRHGGVAQWM